MLKFYLSTIIIWTIILWTTLIMCQKNIISNGWLAKYPAEKSTPFAVVIIASIPFMRALIWVATLVMSAYTPEQLEEFKDKWGE